MSSGHKDKAKTAEELIQELSCTVNCAAQSWRVRHKKSASEVCKAASSQSGSGNKCYEQIRSADLYTSENL